MKSKSKLPVMYMLVLVYIIFSFFNLLESRDVSAVQSASYVFLIIIPLCLMVFSVWRRNVRAEFFAYPGLAAFTPLVIASILVGVGLIFGLAFGVLGLIVGGALALVGFNRIVNFGKPEIRILADVPPGEAEQMNKRHPYEIFKKFQIFPMASKDAGVIHGTEQAHIVMTRDILLLNRLKKNNSLAELLGEGPKEIPAFLKDPDRRWCGVGLDPIAVAVNPLAWKKRLENDPDPITTLETFLSPNLTGSFLIPNPEKSDAGYLFLAGLAQSMGLDEAVEFLGNLKKQAAGMYEGNLDLKDCFGKPNMLAAVGRLHSFLDGGAARLKLLVSVPDGAGWDLMAAAIVKDNVQPALAEEFLEFITEKRGNERFNYKLNFMSTHPRALVPPGSPTLEQSGINKEFDLLKAVEDKEIILQRWRETRHDVSHTKKML